MKGKLILFLIIFCIMFNTVTMASGQVQTITVYFNSVNLNVNGEDVYTDNILYNGTTYIPLRKASELLGCKVGWNEKTNTATLTQYNENKTTAFVFHNLYLISLIFDKCEYIYRISDFEFTKSHWNTTFYNSTTTYFQELEKCYYNISEYYKELIDSKDSIYYVLSDITTKENLDNLYLKLDEACNKSAYIYSLVKNLIESSGYLCTEDEFIKDIRLLYDIQENLINTHDDIYFDYLDYLYK